MNDDKFKLLVQYIRDPNHADGGYFEAVISVGEQIYMTDQKDNFSEAVFSAMNRFFGDGNQ